MNKVVARFADGRIVKGVSMNVDITKPTCHVRTSDGKMEEVRLAEIPDPSRRREGSLLAMDDALERLGRGDALKVQLIEMRYCGGMTAEESATALAMSVHAVRRELRLAQAWLHKEMAG